MMMIACLHHVVNEHEWATGQCNHGALDTRDIGDKEWLEPESQPHVALRKILLDRTWLKNAGERYCNFRYACNLTSSFLK
jgi:hypothetical protein